jgi:hypothetical protein
MHSVSAKDTSLCKFLPQNIGQKCSRILAPRHCFQREREGFANFGRITRQATVAWEKTLGPEQQLAAAGGTVREADFEDVAVFEGLPA